MKYDVKELYETAEKNGLVSALEPFGKNIRVKIPYSVAFSQLTVDSLEFSVRSRNGLRRAGLDTVEKLVTVIMSEQGLAVIRNLGRKSVNEIKTRLLVCAYELLSAREKYAFWTEFLSDNQSIDMIA